MSFDIELLTEVFSNIFHRRPINARLAGSGKLNIRAGGRENCIIEGQYLEGGCSVYPNSNRLTIQDVQQHGELKTTSITCVANATTGNDVNNLGLYGYVAGQQNNETAKFIINNCIDIQDYTPYIHDFTYRIYNYAYPESFLFTVVTNEDVYSLIINGQETTLKEFVYTFKAPGLYTVTIQGKNSNGELSNIVAKQILVPQRPYVAGMYIQDNPAAARYPGTQYQSFYQRISGSYYAVSSLSGKVIPVFVIECNTQAYLQLSPQYVLGDLNSPIISPGFRTYQVIGQSIGHSAGIVNPNLINLNIYASNVTDRAFIYCYLNPVNQLNTHGYSFEFGVDIYTYNFYQNPIVTYSNYPNFRPAPAGNAYGDIVPGSNVDLLGSYRTLQGQIVSLSTSAIITGY